MVSGSKAVDLASCKRRSSALMTLLNALLPKPKRDIHVPTAGALDVRLVVMRSVFPELRFAKTTFEPASLDTRFINDGAICRRRFLLPEGRPRR